MRTPTDLRPQEVIDFFSYAENTEPTTGSTLALKQYIVVLEQRLFDYENPTRDVEETSNGRQIL